jgi:hypothetical protein
MMVMGLLVTNRRLGILDIANVRYFWTLVKKDKKTGGNDEL